MKNLNEWEFSPNQSTKIQVVPSEKEGMHWKVYRGGWMHFTTKKSVRANLKRLYK